MTLEQVPRIETENSSAPAQALSGVAALIEAVAQAIQPVTVLVIGAQADPVASAFSARTIKAAAISTADFLTGWRRDPSLRDLIADLQLEPGQRLDLSLCLDDVSRLSPVDAQSVLTAMGQISQGVLIRDLLRQPSSSTASSHLQLETLAEAGFFPERSFPEPPENSQPASGLFLYFKPQHPAEAILGYARHVDNISQENRVYEQTVKQQQADLARLQADLLAARAQLTRFEGSLAYGAIQSLQQLRARVLPPGSARDQIFEASFRAVQRRDWSALGGLTHAVGRELYKQGRTQLWRQWLRLNPPRQGRVVQVKPVGERPPLSLDPPPVDLIICVHNALEDVQRCLAAVTRHTTSPHRLIIVDDGSGAPTRDFLANLTHSQPQITLLRNETASGYTKAANQGLRQSTAELVVLLNSDTVVTPHWLERLVTCAQAKPQVGLVGPLSNAASWQSIPDVDRDGDWVDNALPAHLSIDQVSHLVDQASARLYPELPFLNGFCLLIKRQVIDQIGYFDEENFGAGYGEENDYLLRARQAGWAAALADDAYVYHAQSRSYDHRRRRQLSERAAIVLAQKHGGSLIQAGLDRLRSDRVLEGIRARNRVMVDRQKTSAAGRVGFQGKRVLWVLPIVRPGGGGHVVIYEAAAMRQMGVDAQLFNLTDYQASFERNHPALPLPMSFGTPAELKHLAGHFDAIVATANFVVEWLVPLAASPSPPILGYYVQEYEPLMYTPGTRDYYRAQASYALIPKLVRFTKTGWTQQMVKQQTGLSATPVGVSLDLDLFRPRPRPETGWPEPPLKLVAMIRPQPPYRRARFTMEILRQIARQYGPKVEIVLFGLDLADPDFADLPRDFPWQLAGILSRQQVAALLNQADIFVDFSAHQAMGLTALEAMACGAAVIAPQQGGAAAFARHEENSLLVDTASPVACLEAVHRLVEDHALRHRLQQRAVVDVCNFYPERAALNILQTLFGPLPATRPGHDGAI